MTPILAAFLVVHGLLHLAIWLPRPNPEPTSPPPFHPDHSGVLTAVHAPARAGHWLAVALALTTAWAYVAAGGFLALSVAGAAGIAEAGAILGIALKVLFFHPWLAVGLILDICLLLAAVTGWPLTFT